MADWKGAPLAVHVVVQPRWEQDQREWSSAEILLNKDTFLPTAIRIMSGANEEVYVFSRTEPALTRVGLWNGNPFNDTPPSNYTCIERADRRSARAESVAADCRHSATRRHSTVSRCLTAS